MNSFVNVMGRILLLLITLFIGNQLFAQVVKEVQFPAVVAEDEEFYGISVPVTNRQLPEVTISDILSRDGRQINADRIVPIVHIALKKKQAFAIISLPLYVETDGLKTALASCKVTITTAPHTLTPPLQQKPTGAANSVLASGNWYKIAVKKRGIYKIDYAFLQSMGLNPSQINPANIRLYGNGGSVLPEKVTDDVIDDLEENSIFVSASGSSFGQNDYILFYAGGPIKWTFNPYSGLFEHTPNYYEDNSYYFLNFDMGNGKRIATQAATGTEDVSLNSFNDYAVVEADSFNPSTVGKVWWGYRLINPGAGSSSLSFNVNMGTLSSPVTMEAQVGGLMDVDGNTYNISINNVSDTNITLNRPASSANMYAVSFKKKTNPGSGNITVKTTLNSAASGTAYLDFMRFNGRRVLSMSGAGGQLSFRDTTGYATNGLQLGFQIQGANANTKVWEVTDPLHPRRLNGSLNGNTYTIVRPADSLREFIAFDGTQYGTPAFISTVDNQNLHSLSQADLLIITRKDMLPAATALADFHHNQEGLRVHVVTVDKIYNEFSSGGQDISGIRNFIKMFYDRADNAADLPKNVLLLGAASYDYKDRIAANTNIVPVYQTAVSIANSDAFSSDDFYALLDEGESMKDISLLDVGVGRIPAYNLEEAQAVVEKIKNYKQNASFGPWKNTFTFVSDNVDPTWSTSHTKDAETVSEVIRNASPVYNQVKLYGDVFPLESTPSGKKMVAQNKALNDQIFLGTFLVNYSGHGGPIRLAVEDLVTESDINSWINFNKLPVFVTATCDFGRFDDPEHRSGGSRIMMKSDGGSIASLTTTQLVYPGPNSNMNSAYLKNQFNKNADNQWNSLGEAVMNAKNETMGSGSFGQYQNNQKFALLADPALKLALPQYNVTTDSLLILDEEMNADTIMALGRYTLKGSVTDEQNALMTGFNGKVYITIFDKPKEIPIVSDPMPPDISEYSSQTSVIYKGIATVINGQFSLSFVVPKDINYSFGKGKISYYAENSMVDASGADTNFTVGGFAANAPEDNEGPIVKAFIDDDKFRDGGVTGPDPLLFVKISDDNGINVTGSSIGHDLIAILDEDADHPFILNNYYQTNPDDFRSGTVAFPMSNIAPGLHRIRVKAWDTYNNSGEGFVTFEVVDKSQAAISEVYNYPNPFTQQTTFVIQHNLSKENLDITIKIFNTSGQLVRTLTQNITPEGNRTEIVWDGDSDQGFAMGSGIYFYKVQIKTKKGIQTTAQQKLSLIR